MSESKNDSALVGLLLALGGVAFICAYGWIDYALDSRFEKAQIQRQLEDERLRHQSYRDGVQDSR